MKIYNSSLRRVSPEGIKVLVNLLSMSADTE